MILYETHRVWQTPLEGQCYFVNEKWIEKRVQRLNTIMGNILIQYFKNEQILRLKTKNMTK